MKTEDPKLHKLASIIEERMDEENLSVNDICHELGLSRSHLHRILKENTGLSLSLYIRKKRMEKAAELLENPGLRISEIADAVGISSPQNFSNYFSQKYGLSPSDYRKQIPEETPQSLSIAVLPFINLSNDQEQEYFSDGITDELINVFSRVPSLKVVGRSSSFSFKGKNEDIRNIGTALGADYLLEGSVRRSDMRLRITAQLSNATDGYQIWAQKYDREMQDVFAIQDDISQAILEEIEVKLLGKNNISPIPRTITNAEAYELYLNGRYHFNKFAGPAEFEKSIEFYRRAIALEPNYSAAYAGIASAYLSLWFYRFLDPETGLAEIRKATAKAIEIDSHDPESLLALARMQMLIEWDFEKAEKSFMRSLELSPDLAETHGQFALFYALTENEEKAINHLQTALSLDPLSLFNIFYGEYVYWLTGDNEKAMSLCRKMLELEPGFWAGHTARGLNLFHENNTETAIEALQLAKSLNYSGFTLSALGAIYGFSGQTNKARGILQEMNTLAATKPVSNYDLGIVYAGLGEIKQAVSYFEKAIEKHEPSMLFFKFILKDWLESYQTDIRYRQLLQKLP